MMGEITMGDYQSNNGEDFINIDRFNQNIKEFFTCQSGEIYGQASEKMDNIYIHMGIRQKKEDGIWLGVPVVNAAFFFSYGDHAALQSYLKNNDKTDFENYGEDENQSKEIMKEEMQSRLKVLWKDYQEDKAVWGWGLSNITNIGADKESEITKYIGNYEILWVVCDVVNDKATLVNQLILETILRFLTECFRDIEEIRQIGNAVNSLELLEKIKERKEFDFLDTYKELVFTNYKLPGEKYCKELSLTPYERREVKGKIILVDKEEFYQKNEKGGKVFLDPKKFVPFNKVKYTRKMLEACNKEQYLAVSRNKHQVLGLLHKELTGEENIVIEYKGTANWIVTVRGEEILCYKKGSYYISSEEYGRKNRIKLDDIEGLDADKCGKIICELNNAKHGALMIIAEDAADEADRLCRKFNRGTIIDKLPVDDEKPWNLSMIAGLTDIDGALLVDFAGNCVAFGVILDGVAKVKGDPRYGSRYNSAKNFIEGTNRIAVVVSEDKDKKTKILYGKSGHSK